LPIDSLPRFSHDLFAHFVPGEDGFQLLFDQFITVPRTLSNFVFFATGEPAGEFVWVLPGNSVMAF
jgi:hypothetical protein